MAICKRRGCDNEFTPRKNSGPKHFNQKYCSKACQQAVFTGADTGKDNPYRHYHGSSFQNDEENPYEKDALELVQEEYEQIYQ